LRAYIPQTASVAAPAIDAIVVVKALPLGVFLEDGCELNFIKKKG